jgi:hypothetical protein
VAPSVPKVGTESKRIKFWLGHAKESVTDKYSELADDVEFRMEIAEAVGMGFDVPSSLRPMKPKKSKEKRLEVAA